MGHLNIPEYEKRPDVRADVLNCFTGNIFMKEFFLFGDLCFLEHPFGGHLQDRISFL